MKHLSLVTGAIVSLALPLWAQPVGGPIELRNPHRRNDIGGQSSGALGSVESTGPASGPVSVSAGVASATTVVPSIPTSAPAVAMFADGRYLFVLRGDSLFKFDKKTLKLLNSTELPHPAVSAPPPSVPREELRSETSPPLHPGSGFKIGPTF